MWILHFLPDTVILWFCNTVLAVGLVLAIAGLFAHRIPLIWQYQLPFKVVGIALLTVGVYFRGGYAIEMVWRERVAELEVKVAEAENRSQQVNTVFRDRVIYRDKIIREQGETLVQFVDREVVKTIPAECNNLSTELIEVHNRAANLHQIVRQLESQNK